VLVCVGFRSSPIELATEARSGIEAFPDDREYRAASTDDPSNDPLVDFCEEVLLEFGSAGSGLTGGAVVGAAKDDVDERLREERGEVWLTAECVPFDDLRLGLYGAYSSDR
jgi:hypothetical protein